MPLTRLLSLAVTTVVVGAAMTACSGGNTPSGPVADTVTIRTPFDVTNFDFQVASNQGNASFTSLGYDSLVALGVSAEGKQTIVPYLAESWTTTPTSVTFKLKQGPTCQDGTPITPAVVKASLERMLAKSANLTSNFQGTQGSPDKPATGTGPFSVTADDAANTVTFTASKPSNQLLNGFLTWPGPAGVSFGAAKIVCPAGLSGDASQLKTGMYGSGPYTLVSSTPGSQVVFKLNPKWTWGPNGATAGKMPQNVIFKIVPNETTAANLALTGELDVLQNSSPADANRIAADRNFEAVHTPAANATALPWGQFTAVIYNDLQPPLNNVNVRKALSMVIDPNALNKAAYLGQADVVGSSALPTSTCYEQSVPGMLGTGTAPDQARSILTSNGFTYSNGSLFNPDGSKLTFEFMSISTNSSTATDYITSQWKALGVDVQIASLDVTTFSTRAQHGQFQAYVGAIPNIGYMSGPDPTKGGLNFSGVQTPEYDQAVASALAAPTIADACPYWKQVQTLIARNYWVLPLFAQPTPNITYVRKGISYQIWGGLSPIASIPSYQLGVLSK